MRFDLGTLDSGEQSLPFGLLVHYLKPFFFKFQNNHIPGILFFLSAATMIVSSLLCFLFTETKGKDLEDTMSTSETAGKSSLMTDMKLNPVFTPVNTDDKFKATNEGNIVTKF